MQQAVEIEGELFNIHGPIVSAQADAQQRQYRLLTGKSGKRWLVAIQPNEADNIYVEGDKGSDGFGGATLRFLLEDGTELALKGPWKVAPSYLLEDTGYDATQKCRTIGIIATERESSKQWYGPDLYRGVLYKDAEPVVGDFDRIPKLAQQFADELGRRVYFGKRSEGGGHGGCKEPKQQCTRDPLA